MRDYSDYPRCPSARNRCLSPACGGQAAESTIIIGCSSVCNLRNESSIALHMIAYELSGQLWQADMRLNSLCLSLRWVQIVPLSQVRVCKATKLAAMEIVKTTIQENVERQLSSPPPMDVEAHQASDMARSAAVSASGCPQTASQRAGAGAAVKCCGDPR
jgi:hypothetical protein